VLVEENSMPEVFLGVVSWICDKVGKSGKCGAFVEFAMYCTGCDHMEGTIYNIKK